MRIMMMVMMMMTHVVVWLFIPIIRDYTKSVLLYLNKESADDVLDDLRTVLPSSLRRTQLLSFPLNMVFQLNKAKRCNITLIPEASQIKNALTLMEREKAGASEEFLGIPVFQSRRLTFQHNNRTYCPVFFRKEDLESTFLITGQQKRCLNPILTQGEIEVASFESIIKEMKDGSCGKWDDVMFVPPESGFDFPADPSLNRASLAP